MTGYDLQEPLQPLPPALDHLVRKPIGKHLARQRWNIHPRTLALKNIPKVLKVRIPPPYTRVHQFERWHIDARDDLVVGVHLATDAVGERVAYFHLDEVLGDAVHVFNRLAAWGAE